MTTGALRDLVSARVGIVRSVGAVPRAADEPVPPVIHRAILSHFDFRSAPPSERATAGKGLTDAEAERSAIAEAVERYCAVQVDPSMMRRATWRDVAPNAIAPGDCVLYSARQYEQGTAPAVRWNENDEITWARGRELPEDRDVWLPASLVYLALPPDPRERFCEPTSSGLAAGASVAMAVLHALYELVERDAFLLTWMNKLPAPEIDLTGIQGPVARIAVHFARLGRTLRVFDVAVDIAIPVMMAVVVDTRGAGPAVIVGLGCNLDPKVALMSAVLEVCQTNWAEGLRRRSRLPGAVDPVRYRDVRTLEDHAAFASGIGHLQEFAFLFDRTERRAIGAVPNTASGSVERDLTRCIELVTAARSRVAYADLTTPDVRPYGIHVVRAIATGLQPIHFGFGHERLGGRRLFEVARRMGHASTDRTEADLNPCPHPLA